MKKIFTTALIATAVVAGASAEQVEKRIYLQNEAPVNVPEGVEVVHYAAGDNADASQIHFYIWESTFDVVAGADPTYGDYSIYQIGNVGWWGAGYNVPPKYDKVTGAPTGNAGVDFRSVNEDWKLHFVMKTNITDGDICFNLGAAIPGSLDGNGNAIMPSIKFNAATTTDYKFDNTWNVIDIPVTYFLDQYASAEQGLEEFCKMYRDANYLTFTGGGSAGSEVAFTDIYLYGMGDPGAVEGVEADNSPVVATEYYNFQGQKLAEAPESGLYIVKNVKANGSVAVSKVAK